MMEDEYVVENYDLIVYLTEHGVFAIAEQKPYGVDALYYLDGTEHYSAYEADEFSVIGTFEFMTDKEQLEFLQSLG